MSNFNKKIVLISGGTRGIGRCAAIKFAQQGATVIALYRSNQEAAEACLDELIKINSMTPHKVLQCDITDAVQLETLVNQIASDYRCIDVLVNNAGIGPYHPFESTDFATWQHMWRNTLATNLFAAANLTFLVAKIMQQQGAGHIVNVSSRGAFRGEPDKPAYGASKAAINALTQSLAVKLGEYGISVTAVAPGFVETELTEKKLSGKEGEAIRAQSPFNRVARTEDVANAILYLASAEASFSSGAILDVNGASYLRS